MEDMRRKKAKAKGERKRKRKKTRPVGKTPHSSRSELNYKGNWGEWPHRHSIYRKQAIVLP